MSDPAALLLFCECLVALWLLILTDPGDPEYTNSDNPM